MLDWALANDDRAEAIAAEGRRFAEGMFGDACVGELLRAALGEYARAPIMRGAPKWACPIGRGCRSLPWADDDLEGACEAADAAKDSTKSETSTRWRARRALARS